MDHRYDRTGASWILLAQFWIHSLKQIFSPPEMVLVVERLLSIWEGLFFGGYVSFRECI